MRLKKLLDWMEVEMVQWDSAWEETDITSVSLLSEGITPRPGIAYIGKGSPPAEPVIPGTTFICCERTDRPCPPTGQRNVFSTPEPFSVLLDRLYGVFNDSVQMAQCMERLMEKSSAGLGIHSLLEEVYNLTQVPIFLVDGQYHPISYNRGILRYPDFDQAIEQHILPDRRIRNINREDMKQAFQHYEDLFFMWAELDQEYILTTVLRIGGMEAGHFIAYVGRDDPLKYYRLIQFTCRLLALELQKNIFFQQNEGVLEAQFLRHLIENTLTDPEREEFLSRLEWGTAPGWQLLLLSAPEGSDGRAQTLRAVREIALCTRQCHSVFYGGYLVALCVTQPQTSLALESILRRFGLLCAISSEFNDLSKTGNAYSQAREAIRYLLNGAFDGPVIRYSDCMYRIMATELGKTCDIEQFLHPGVLRLRAHDRQGRSELIRTLAVYLEYNNDPDTAAERLHIHRNTLYYRINKLQNDFGLDLKSGSQRMHILLTLELLKGRE